MSRAEDQLEIELEFDDEPKPKEHLAIELHQPTFIYKALREMSNVEVVSGGGDTEEGGKQEPEAGQDGGSAQPDDKSKTSEKITLLLKATANAPIMKKKKWVVEPDRTVASVNNFVRKLLQLDENESLFLYVNQSFAPSPDQTIRNLYSCFETDGKLILQYCTTQAWG
ncbi:Ubiquitin-like autophagy protein Apg12 [Nesidiocoris tenuis]|uniref:Ubiquitin-like protein ATG12 n=1 Tax=Nesidiocoris tenuis TaxID=355587 RepID=A0ABN7B413_9HEMI|nr:Ubiquitin-like autophagy protein Apg12 [Nesidiocoris tenuis]